MSLTSSLRVYRTSKLLAYVSSFVEMAFFCAAAALCFLGGTLLCAVISARAGGTEFLVTTSV